MIMVSPEDRISADELIENSYFDDIRQDTEILKPASKIVDANVKFTSAEEVAGFLVREIKALR
jgi:hypothetical protein